MRKVYNIHNHMCEIQNHGKMASHQPNALFIWYNCSIAILRIVMIKRKVILLRRVKTVAVISDIVMPTVRSEYLIGIAKYAQARQDLSIRCIDVKNVKSGNSLGGCDGVILDTDDKKVLEIVSASDLPVVDTTCSTENPNFIRVDNDVKAASVMAAEWFLGRGFKNFAYCGVSPDDADYFAATVAKAGHGCLIYDEEKLTRKKPTTDHLPRLLAGLKAWVPKLPTNTAVLCSNDIRALHILDTCLKLGRSVPDDIAIMGQYNDIAVCTCSPVTMTSIDSDIQGVSHAAMRILDAAMRRPFKRKLRPPLLIPPIGIVERESTATYPVKPSWIAKTLLLLDANLDKQISAKDLARAAGVSQTALQKAFHKTFAKSIGKYITSLKMRTARRLFNDEGLSVKEVSSRTGFSSPNYFCHVYQAFYGHPPSADRRKR